MRGRVMAILLATLMGTTPLGAPIVGWVADTFGPRWALGVGATAGLLAAGVGIRYLRRHRHLRVHYHARGLHFSYEPAPVDDPPPFAAKAEIA